MKYTIGYHTDKGIKKAENQDSLLIQVATSPYGRIGLFAICDGMGGLASGELASATVLAGFKKMFEEELQQINFNSITNEEIYEAVSNKVIELNTKLLDYGIVNDIKLGTTLTLLLTVNNKGYIFQVGDSRLYKITDTLEQLTSDQSYVQREIERGNMTVEEAKVHPKKNLLLQCIGAKKKVDIKMDLVDINNEDTFLLCSDGFHRKLEESEVIDRLKYNDINSIDEINNSIKTLVDLAKERNELDNITAIVIQTKK